MFVDMPGATQWRPPSIYRICPVMKLAASDARKAAASAQSDGCPTLPSG